ncbi:protein phosphatase [Streptomyces cyaneogriseus subsp. noncyanogenus]|uniref:Protein phosphatase n=1 Tax=Streptomyces cyaneogriseus subsp. noncyanogenus TaxID=477245 RepID=A0A0C5G901_9ACTN|nr:protein phosphatase [Streptomyces cyaneogriseus subsp. noncyanogenus]
MTSEHATPAGSGAAPDDTATLAKVVARQRAEMDRLRDLAAATAVVERAKGAVMALTGCSAQAAAETLAQRAEAAGRTVLEESWVALGGFGAVGAPHPGPAAADPPPAAGKPGGAPGRVSGTTCPDAPEPPAADGASASLARLARDLVHVGTPQDLARCLLEHLAPDAGADAVMLYARLPSGGLELIGHAGIDKTLAAQWHRVPPLNGMAPLDVLRDRRPRWLEDIERDREHYLLIGDPPERWRSRAWLPVATGDAADVCLGVLRRAGGPFPPATREHLRAVALLCAGRLRTFGTRPEPAAGGTADAVQRVLDALPVAAMLLTPLRASSGAVHDYRIDAATEQAADVVGRGGGELIGRRLTECLPAAESAALRRGCLHTLLTGKPYEGPPFAHQKVVGGVAELSTYSVRVAALDGGLVLTWIRHDSSDRQEQRLADLQRLGNLGWATWNLSTHVATWSSQVFAIFGRNPARGPVRLTDLPGLALPDEAPALDRAVRALIGEGRPLDLPFRTRTPAGVRHLRFVAEAVTGIDGTPVEVLGFVQDLTARRRAELALVESERAMLTQHDVLRAERTLAARLQDALLPLPRRPLEPAGLRVEVAYLPAQSGVYVGGDWFSAIELPDGDALFVVGDVAGHGVDAVATMAQLRFTAKGMVITGSSLTGALARLNTLLLHSRGSHGTASMVMARYQPAGRRLLWAQAGHPPPLLLRGGRARYLDRPSGILLGATTSPVFREAECRLRPGDRIIFYTDGLVERPPESIDRGLERLAEAAVAHHVEESGSLGTLLAAMLEDERRDDVCVLDIRVPGESGDDAA